MKSQCRGALVWLLFSAKLIIMTAWSANGQWNFYYAGFQWYWDRIILQQNLLYLCIKLVSIENVVLNIKSNSTSIHLTSTDLQYESPWMLQNMHCKICTKEADLLNDQLLHLSRRCRSALIFQQRLFTICIEYLVRRKLCYWSRKYIFRKCCHVFLLRNLMNSENFQR